MEKYNKFFSNIVELIEKGLYSSKDIKKELEGFIKFQVENVANRLNLVSREEFEIQKKLVENLKKDLKKVKKKKPNKKN